MAKVKGPLFSLQASGSFGQLIFDRRGYVRFKGTRRDAKSRGQGNFRQALMAAQQCVKICGPSTRQLLKAAAETPSAWHLNLVKQLIGPHRATYAATLQQFNTDPAVDQSGWESAAQVAGLRPVDLPYADESGASPGAQLFALASTLYGLGVYAELGQPNGNAAAWQARIGS